MRFCFQCNRTHNICSNCYNNSTIKIINNKKVSLRCCQKCFITNHDKKIIHTWKNQWLFDSKNYKEINYSSSLQQYIVILLCLLKYNQDGKTNVPYLPTELWFYIFKNINLNTFSRFMYKYHHNGFCETCRKFHYNYVIVQIKNIMENYSGELKYDLIKYYICMDIQFDSYKNKYTLYNVLATPHIFMTQHYHINIIIDFLKQHNLYNKIITNTNNYSIYNLEYLLKKNLENHIETI